MIVAGSKAQEFVKIKKSLKYNITPADKIVVNG
jgi:hypothetical protein